MTSFHDGSESVKNKKPRFKRRSISFFVRIIKQEIDRFFDHLLRFFNGPPLTGHAELRTSRHEPVILAFDYRREFGKLHQGNTTASVLVRPARNGALARSS